MKRMLAFVLCLLLCIPLPACAGLGKSIKEPVTFYYPRSDYDYHAVESVMGYEMREAMGHRADLRYLVSIYLYGPLGSGLLPIFPAGTKLQSITVENNMLTVELTDTGRALSDSGFSLACACFSRTFFGILNVEAVTVVSGKRTLTTMPDSCLFLDSAVSDENTAQGGTSQ